MENEKATQAAGQTASNAPSTNSGQGAVVYVDESSLEANPIMTGSLLQDTGQRTYVDPRVKHRSRTTLIISIIMILVAAVIGTVSAMVARQQRSQEAQRVTNIAEQEVELGTLKVDNTLTFGSATEKQKLIVNGDADFQGDIKATNFDGNFRGNFAGIFTGDGSNIQNLRAVNCTDCVALQPNTPGITQIGGLSLTGTGRFGAVGVGTGTPAYAVDVIGDINASSSLRVNGVTVCTASGCGNQNVVASLNGLTGGLSIANASGAGTTITINDASTTAKGLAQFNASNFLVSGGTVNTIQDITTVATPIFAGVTLSGNLTVGTSGIVFSNTLRQTAATNDVTIDAGNDQIVFAANGINFQLPSVGGVSQTICTSGSPCVGGGSAVLLAPGGAQTDSSADVSIFINDTGGGNLLQLQSGGTDRFTVGNTGNTTIAGSLVVNTITPSSSFTVGSASQQFTVQGNAASTITASNGGFTSSVGFATPTANRTITFPNASGTVAVSASGNIALSAAGNITFTGTLPVLNGGTGASDAATARTNLSAAASGSNSDITATTALASATGLNTITPNAAFSLGATGQAFTLQGAAASVITATSGSFTTTIGFATPTANAVLNFPALSAGTYTLCTTSGNCAGVGGGVTSAGGTTNQLAKFTGSQVIGDSIISDNGSVVTIAGDEVIQGSGGLTVGTGTVLGRIAFRDGSSAFSATLQPATLTAGRTITIPNAGGTLAVSASGNIALSAAGNITLTGQIPVLNGGTGASDAATARSNLAAAASGANGDITSTTALNTITPSSSLTIGATGQAFTLQGSATSVVTATSGGFTTSFGFVSPTANATINLPALSAGTYTVCTTSGNCLGGGGGGANTALSNLTSVAINTSLLPGAAGTVNLGSATLPFGTVSLAGTSGTPGTNNFVITGASTGGTRTITLPDASGTVAVSASGNIALSAAGNITFTGTLPVLNGGTGASDAATARSNLSAAASGANSDITSLSGLTTALSVGQGGTGANNASGARSNLGAAASGSNGDITATTALASATGLNTITPNAAMTIGATGQSFALQGTAASVITATNGGNTTTVGFVTPSANVTLNFPALSAGSYTLCTTSGNCAGVGGGVTTAGGTTNQLAKFTGAQAIGDSIITDNGSIVTIAGAAEIQGSGGVTVGTGSVLGRLFFRDGSSAFSATLQPAILSADRTITIPNAGGTLAVSASGNIALSASGNITFTGTLPVLNGGTGASDAATARSNLGSAASGANSDITSTSALATATNLNTITPNAALTVGATSQVFTLQGNASSLVTATSGGNTTSFGFTTPTANTTINLPALSAGSYTVCTTSGNCLGSGGGANAALSNLASVAINTSLLPGSASIDLGDNTAPFRDLYLGGTGTNNFRFTGTASAARTLTIPDASGTLAVSASGNIALSGGGNITFTGTLPVLNGGTGASDAATARTNLSAAASGSNGDITATTALATATGLNTITPNAAFTLGATGQAFTLQGNASSVITATGGGFTTTIGFSGSPTASQTYNFDRTAAAGTYTICTTAGNCVGGGGGVTTPGGTTNALAKFTGSQTLGDSILSDNGTVVTIAGSAVLQGSGGLTIGVASSVTGQIVLNNATNGNTVTLQSGTPGSSVVLTLPTTDGANGDCLISDGSGVLSFSSCTGGAGGGVTSIDGQTGVVTLDNATGSSGVITIDNASTSAKGIAQFNSTNFTASSGTINTIQNIDTTAAPSFAGLNVTTTTGLTLGTGTAAGRLFVRDGSSANAVTFQTGILGANRTITIPDAAGTLAVSASGNIALSAAGNITFTGTLPVLNGGTGASDAATARTNLGAAASGANSDITSTSALASATGLNTITPSAAMTIGATGQSFTLQGTAASIITATNGGNTTTVGFVTPTANVTLNYPALSAGTYQLCTTSGNCASVGGGVTTAGGTTNQLAKFTGSQVIGDSIISDSGTVVTIAGAAEIQGSGGVTVGTASVLGRVLFRDGSSAFSARLQPATLSADRTITIPNAGGTLAVSASGNIALDAAGNITFTGQLPVVNGGTGASDAATARSNLSAAASGANSDITSTSALATATNLNTITPNASLAVGATSQAFTLQGNASSLVTATSGGNTTSFGFATPTANTTINLPALSAGSYTVCTSSGNCLGGGSGGANTALSNLTSVAINTSLLSGNSSVDLGDNTNPFRDLYLGGTGTNNFRFTGTASAARTLTVPDASGTLAVSASGNIALSGAGNITFTGTLPVLNGGTGASDAATARTNLSAAASGANSDITSTTALNTITPGGAFTLGATTQTALLQGSTTSITSTGAGNDITLTSADAIVLAATGNITFSGFNCTTFSNGGALTTDASGNITCSNDDGGGAAGATTALDNLASVAINTSLLSDADNTDDLGSSAFSWRSLYADTSVFTPSVDTAAAAALDIGTTTQNALTLGRSGATTAVNGSTITIAGTTNINTGSTADTSVGNATGSITITGSSSSTFVLNGSTVDATEFNRLDGKDAALVDTNDAVATAITGTGALNAGSITSGFGAIDIGTDTITSGAINGQTISSTASFTGTVAIQGSSSLTLGTASSNTGSAIFQNSTNANTITLQTTAGGTSGSYILQLPSLSAGTYDICTTSGNCLGGGGGGANTALSNLSSVAINTSLLTGADNTIDLGSAAFAWRTLYADTSVLTPLVDTVSAGTLAIGTANATAISIADTGVTTTVGGELISVDDLTVGSATVKSSIYVNDGYGNEGEIRYTSNGVGLGTLELVAQGTNNTIAQFRDCCNAILSISTTSNASTFHYDLDINGVLAVGDAAILGSSSSDTITFNGTVQGANPLIFEGGSADANELTLAIAALTGDQTITLPDASGTVCLTSGNCLGGSGGANTALSNLSSVAINTSLLSDADNTDDLGSSAFSWRTLYADTSVLTPSVDVASAGALAIGNATATSVTICNSAACDTITIGTNADADTITVGDSLDTFSLASTGLNVSTAGAVSGVTTLTFSNSEVIQNTTNGQIVVNTAVPTASSTTAAVLIGATNITGGDAQGTYLGINSASSYVGDFINFQQGNTSLFRVNVANASDPNGILIQSAASGQNATISSTGQSTQGLDIYGAGTGAVTISNYGAGTVNIGTDYAGASQLINIGGVNADLTIDSDTLDLSAGGVLSGITGLTMASGNFLQSGSGTFATGTGAVSLNGNTTVAAGNSLTLVGGTTGTRPGTPAEGMLYYDTTTDKLLVYSNGKWQADRTTATKIVAASNSSQAVKDSADYVADGTGDQVEINAALAAAAGGTVYLAEGTYVAAATIEIPNYTTLAGAGRATIIELGNLDTTENLIENDDMVSGTAVTLRDVHLDGRSDLNTAGTQHGLFTDTIDGLTVERVSFRRFRDDAMSTTNSFNIAYKGVTVSSSSTALRIDSSGPVMVSDATLEPTLDGIVITSGSQDIRISDSRLNNAGNDAISIDSSSVNVLITGNTFMGFGANGVNDDAVGTVISGNTFTDSSAVGVYVSGSGGLVSGNTFVNVGNSAVSLTGAGTVAVDGNTLTTTLGIYLSGSHNNVITNNRISDSGIGTNNDGIYLTGSDFNSITGNAITDSSCTVNCYAINISDSTSDKNYVADNRFIGSSADAASIRDLGTNTIYAGQQVNGSNSVGSDVSNFLFRGSANSATAFAVQNASGTSVLNVNTSTAGIAVTGVASISGAASGDALTVSNSTSTGNIAVFSDNATAVFTIANGGGVTLANETNSATAFRIQNATAADTLLTADTTARGAGGGNLIKVGNSTGTDGDTTILVVDSATAAPTSNLSALNGGLFYNSTTNRLSVIENGQVKVLCNQTDASCGGNSTTLQQAYDASTGGTTAEIKLDSTRTALDIQDANTSIAGNLLNIRASSGSGLGQIMVGVGNTGAVTLQNSTDQTNAFQIQNATGNRLVNISTNSYNQNLLINASFEGSTEGWARFEGSESTFATTTSGAQSGTQALQITTGAGTANQGAEYYINFKSNTTYTFSVYASVSSGSISTFDLGFVENAGAATTCVSGQTLTTTPTRITCSFTTSTITTAGLGTNLIFARRSTAAAVTIYLDAAQLEYGSSATTFADIPVPNLLPNPSIENGINGWSAAGTSAAVAPSTNYANFGTTSLRFVTGTQGSANQGIARYFYDFKPSTRYSFSFYARRDTSNTGANMSFGRSDDTNTETSCSTGNTFNTTWTQFSCTFTTGSTIGATNASYLYIKQTDTTTDTLFIDGVTLVVGGTALAYGAPGNVIDVEPIAGTIALNTGYNGELQPWRTATTDMVVSQSGLSNSAAYNGYIYMAGGNESGNATNRVQFAKTNPDGSVGAWQDTEYLPIANGLEANAAVAVNGYLYSLGGNNLFDGRQRSVFYAKIQPDGTLDFWNTTMPMPDYLDTHSVVAANGYIYAIGGNDGSSYQSTVYYAKVNGDGTLGTWQTNSYELGCATMGCGSPSLVRQSAALVANNRIYVLGGGGLTASNEFLSAPLNKDGSTGAWTVDIMPDEVFYPAAFAQNGYVYVVGGGNSDSSVNLNSVYYARLLADGSVGDWVLSTQQLPEPKAAAGFANVNGYFYIFGGYDGAGEVSTVFYTSAARVMVTGTLDLVGNSSFDGSGGSSAGGALIAGNTSVVGTLQVQSGATFNDSLSVNAGGNFSGDLAILGQANNTLHTFSSTCSCIVNATAGAYDSFDGDTGRNGAFSMANYGGTIFVATKENNAAGVYALVGDAFPRVSDAVGKIISGDTANVDAIILTVYNGLLYAGTQTGNNAGAVYSYDGTSWTLLNSTRGTFGADANIDGVSAMRVWNGKLYIVTQETNLASVYRYEGGTTSATAWTRLNTTAGAGLAESADIDEGRLIDYGGALWYGTVTGNSTGRVYKYDGNAFTLMNTTAGTFATGTANVDDVTSMTVHANQLFIGTGETNLANIYVFKGGYDGGAGADVFYKTTATSGRIDSTNDATDIDSVPVLRSYNGRLYAGSNSAGLGALYEYTGVDNTNTNGWTIVNSTRGTFGAQTGVDMIDSLQVLNGVLYVGTEDSTSNNGSVYSWGKNENQSYALKFGAYAGNFASISFVGDLQGTNNQNNTGSFVFSNGIMSSAGAYDIAEDYPTRDDSLEAGDLVSIDTGETGFVKKASGLGDPGLVGVFSSDPALRLSQKDATINGGRAVPIALAGRVPVKVTTENGPILPGDAIMTSSVPGVGAKAVGPGRIVGMAMEGFAGEGIGRVVVFVNPNWYQPNSSQLIQATGGSFTNLSVTGLATVQEMTVTGSMLVAGLATIADLKVTGLAEIQTLKVLGNAEFAGDIRLKGTVGQRNAITKAFIASKEITAGSIVVVDSEKDNHVTTTTAGSDTAVLGVAIADALEGEEVEVAIGGTIQVRVETTIVDDVEISAPVTGGNLIVTSTQEGRAAVNTTPSIGSVLGKATSKADANHLVWVIITLQ